MDIERLLKLKDTDEGKIEMIISNNLDLMYKGKACVTIDNWDKLTNEILAWHKYENEKLVIQGVVASVLCVDTNFYSYIEKGAEYELIKESNDSYFILNDNGFTHWYAKKLFVKSTKK